MINNTIFAKIFTINNLLVESMQEYNLKKHIENLF